MQRDLDLIRRILLDVENDGTDSPKHTGFNAYTEDGYALEAVHYHLQLLHDAGLIVADELVPGQWWPERLTWAGHEFLDAARDDARWARAKETVATRAGSAPFRVMHDVLLRLVDDSLTHRPSRKK